MSDLRAYACNPSRGRGRLVPEPASPYRSDYQRDRDRIVHSTAFRRLKHKTQVFVYKEGDHFRTRLTHTIEVAQVARAIARALGLNEDLTEALALAHDLGHTPFGHAGERELNACMVPYGGFEHNAQAVRIVTSLERRYAGFDGLNLTGETLDGLIKHNGPLVDADGDPAGPFRERGLNQDLLAFAGQHGFDIRAYASAEAQVAAVSDEIAYNAHDIDDGLRAKLFDVIDLGDIPLAGKALGEVLKTWPRLDRARLIHETVRRIITLMTSDIIENSTRLLRAHGPESPDDICRAGTALVGFSAQLTEDSRVLNLFLHKRVYRHDKVKEIMGRARRVVRDLFQAYMEDPAQMPEGWREDGKSGESEDARARRVCDFIAGMTDRYALSKHKALFDVDTLFR